VSVLLHRALRLFRRERAAARAAAPAASKKLRRVGASHSPHPAIVSPTSPNLEGLVPAHAISANV
jgi:hypothetical protein